MHCAYVRNWTLKQWLPSLLLFCFFFFFLCSCLAHKQGEEEEKKKVVGGRMIEWMGGEGAAGESRIGGWVRRDEVGG